MASGNDLTLDIKPCWLNPIRRLQACVQRSTGLSIVTIKFLVNEHGEPIQWTEPQVTLLEPKNYKEAILRLFGK